MDIFEREKFKEAIKQIKDNEDMIIEQAYAVANQLKHYYSALKEKGFTKEEALRIVIAHGTTPGQYKGNI